MIDLLSLTLPGIDDSAPDPMKSRFMARAGVVDGVSVVASTKHILPGLIRSTGSQIRGAAGAFSNIWRTRPFLSRSSLAQTTTT